jgi:glycosyltransferase involved in cell wall biosynthesis
MKSKVAFLTLHHPVMDARIFYKEAQSLHRAGYDVSLLVPVHEDGLIWWTTNSRKKPWPGREMVLEGIRIMGFQMKTPAKICHLPKTTWIQRWLYIVCQWLRFSTGGWIDVGPNPFSEMIEKGAEIEADVYHCHEVDSLYAGLKIKKRLKKQGRSPKLIYDVHEFPPASYSRKLRENRGLTRGAVTRWIKKCLLEVDHIITVNQIIRGYLLSLNPRTKAEVLYNCPVLSIFHDYDQKADDGRITLCHEGNLFFNRGLKNMLEVMRILKERYQGKVRFLIIGDALFDGEVRYIDQKVKEYQIEDVIQRTGWLPYEKVGENLCQGTIGIIFLEPEENNMFSTPNKLFNYMRYGLPVVAVDRPEIRRILLETRSGIIVKEQTVQGLVDALSLLIDHSELRVQLGENARRAVYERYSWEVIEKNLLRIYNELTSSSGYVL